MWTLSSNRTLMSFALVGVVGLLSFFGQAEKPDAAVGRFVKIFLSGDGKALLKIIDPDIVEGKELRPEDVGRFLARFRGRSLSFSGFRVNERLTSEDGKTERFRATLLFDSAPISRDHPGRTRLEMTLQWVSGKGKWWLERPLSITYRVSDSRSFPTAEQNDLALRFNTAVQVLEKIGLPGEEDIAISGPCTPGSAAKEYMELVRLHQKERGRKGVSRKSRGVQVLLKGASRVNGGLLALFHGDFKRRAKDKRGPVPYDVFLDYAKAAIRLGKQYQREGRYDRAGTIYRRIVSLGRQFLNEPGGLNFLLWGFRFEKMGATLLARLPETKGLPSREDLKTFVALTSRRLDLVKTAMGCLDDMADYHALKTAMVASERVGDPYFRPWAINTLAILSLKGAPADQETIGRAQAMVIIDNQAMKRAAARTLDKIASNPSDPLRAFVGYQRNWVKGHQVYGGMNLFN